MSVGELQAWLKDYPPVIVFILPGVAFALHLFKRALERSMDTRFAALEKRLARRSTFEERVLADRYAVVKDLVARLHNIFCTLLCIRAGGEPPEGFHAESVNEITGIPVRGLTCPALGRIAEDLESYRFLLADEFYALFRKKVDLAEELTWRIRDVPVGMASSIGPDRERPYVSMQLGRRVEEITAESAQLDEEIRRSMEKEFRISEIHW